MHKSPKSNKRRDTLKYVGLDSKNKSNSYTAAATAIKSNRNSSKGGRQGKARRKKKKMKCNRNSGRDSEECKINFWSKANWAPPSLSIPELILRNSVREWTASRPFWMLHVRSKHTPNPWSSPSRQPHSALIPHSTLTAVEVKWLRGISLRWTPGTLTCWAGCQIVQLCWVGLGLTLDGGGWLRVGEGGCRIRCAHTGSSSAAAVRTRCTVVRCSWTNANISNCILYLSYMFCSTVNYILLIYDLRKHASNYYDYFTIIRYLKKIIYLLIFSEHKLGLPFPQKEIILYKM